MTITAENSMRSLRAGILICLSIASFAAQAALGVTVASAQQASYQLLEPLPCLKGFDETDPNCSKPTMTEVDFEGYVAYAFNFIIALAAVAAVFMIIWGGFEYMTGTSASSKSAGIDKLKNALYGLLLALSSFLILRTINPRLVEIPSTLVPKITIDCSKNPTNPVCNKRSSFFDQLTADLDSYANYKADMAAIKNEITALAEKEKQLQKDLTDVEAAILALEESCPAGCDAEYEELIKEKGRIINEAADNRAQSIRLKNRGAIASAAQISEAQLSNMAAESLILQSSVNEKHTELNTRLNERLLAIDAATKKSITELGDLGGASYAAAIKNDAQYTKDMLRVYAAMQNYRVDAEADSYSEKSYKDKWSNQIQAVITATKITDPALKQAFVTQAQQSITEIKNVRERSVLEKFGSTLIEAITKSTNPL